MYFERTALVTVESVQDIDEVIEGVDTAVETATLILLDQDAECRTEPSRDEKDSIIGTL